MNSADVVFSYGGKITEVIAGELQNKLKIVEFPSGISKDWIRDKEDVQPSGDVLRFLFVGRFDRLKGLPELYSAISKLNEGGRWVLEIVGPIPVSKRLSHPNVRYIGEIKDAMALREIYDRNDVLLCPSISEGMPNVIMEAMARGLAIIATDVGATQILVRKENGWCIESAKPSLILSALNSSLELESEELMSLKIASIMLMKESFTWEEVAKRFNNWLRGQIEWTESENGIAHD